MIPLGLLFNRFTAAAAGVALAFAAYAWHRRDLIQQGYSAAMSEVAAHQAQMERELLREFSRLTERVKGIQNAYTKQSADVAAFRAGQRAAEQRLRQQKADFDERIKTATADSLRQHAQAADDNFERCLGHVERFATEAASCSGAAHALRANLDATTQPAGQP